MTNLFMTSAIYNQFIGTVLKKTTHYKLMLQTGPKLY